MKNKDKEHNTSVPNSYQKVKRENKVLKKLLMRIKTSVSISTSATLGYHHTVLGSFSAATN